MGGRKADPKDTPQKQSGLTVVAPFAYATAKDGEVVQLVKGDVVDEGRFTKESVAHLESIGLVGKQD